MHKKLMALASLALMSAGVARAEYPVNYEASLTALGGSGDFAPYYMSALEGGRFTSPQSILLDGKAWRPMSRDTRFSYGFGVELAAGYSSSVDYEKYSAKTSEWVANPMRPASAWVQQLYGEVKYRGVFLEAGMKERHSAFLNDRLTSGDLVESGNAKPIPQVRVGFIDFQDVPFTKGWLQIQGEVAYGKFIDRSWMEDFYNYYTAQISTGEIYNYKRLYFRIAPRERFTFTIGMQASGQIGGETKFYHKGVQYRYQDRKVTFGDLVKMLIPYQDGGDDYYSGNHLGSWDLQARYKLRNGDVLRAYGSWPWEDGSGIGKLNGWDGLWGIEYTREGRSAVTGAVIEYLDFTNQSGPLHFAHVDYPGTTIPGAATGCDDYYNNVSYRAYANYGMSIGTPALMAPRYNLDGYPLYVGNRMRGFHCAVEGYITPAWSYRVKAGYRRAWGSAKYSFARPIDLTSVMLEATWNVESVSGLKVMARAELDRGDMPCNAAALMVGVKYDGIFNFGNRRK